MRSVDFAVSYDIWATTEEGILIGQKNYASFGEDPLKRPPDLLLFCRKVLITSAANAVQLMAAGKGRRCNEPASFYYDPDILKWQQTVPGDPATKKMLLPDFS